MLLEYIIWAFVFYWLFRFVFNFLVPVFRVTKQMRGQMRDFQNTPTGQHYQQNGPYNQSTQYNNTSQQHTNRNSSTSSSTPQQKPKADDYIDFEEIK